jgi:hypothetical protein
MIFCNFLSKNSTSIPTNPTGFGKLEALFKGRGFFVSGGILALTGGGLALPLPLGCGTARGLLGDALLLNAGR